MSIRAEDLPKRLPLSGIVNAAGICTIRFQTQGQAAWEVSQITAEMPTAPFGCTGTLRVNDSLVSPFVAPADAMAGDPPLPVYPGDVVEIEWTGATPLDQGRALVIYRTAYYSR